MMVFLRLWKYSGFLSLDNVLTSLTVTFRSGFPLESDSSLTSTSEGGKLIGLSSMKATKKRIPSVQFGIVNRLSKCSALRKAKAPNSSVGTGMAAFSELPIQRQQIVTRKRKLIRTANMLYNVNVTFYSCRLIFEKRG